MLRLQEGQRYYAQRLSAALSISSCAVLHAELTSAVIAAAMHSNLHAFVHCPGPSGPVNSALVHEEGSYKTTRVGPR